MTAVKWLKKQLKETYNQEGRLPLAYTLDLVKQAEEMEKEQLEKKYQQGKSDQVKDQQKPQTRY